jgi:integrase
MREYETKAGRRFAGDVTTTDPSGREIRARKSGMLTKSKAVAWEEATATLIQIGRYEGESSSRQNKYQVATVKKVFELCVEDWKTGKRQLKGSTIRHYERAFNVLDGGIEFKVWNTLTQTDVDRATIKDAHLVSPWRHYVLNAMNRSAQAIGQGLKSLTLDFSPDVSKNRIQNETIRWMSPEEFGEMLTHLKPYYQNLAIVLVSTGMRIGELMGLEWPDVDFKRRQLTIKRTMCADDYSYQTPKSGKSRVIPMSDLAIGALKNLASLRFIPPHVLCRPSGEPLSYNVIYETLKFAGQDAGVENFRPHMLRHSAATWALQSGAKIETIRDLLGHSSLDMSIRYAHISATSLQDAVSGLESFSCVKLASIRRIGAKKVL